MSDAYLKATQREMERLEELLSHDPNFVKWKALQGVVEAFTPRTVDIGFGKFVPVSPGTAVIGVGSTGTTIAAALSPKPESNARQIQNAGVAYLRQKGSRAMSRELTEAIERAGVEIRGGDKVAVVAAHMSALKDLVDNVRGEGYGLKEWATSFFEGALNTYKESVLS